jgi:hypothetical protein
MTVKYGNTTDAFRARRVWAEPIASRGLVLVDITTAQVHSHSIAFLRMSAHDAIELATKLRAAARKALR